MENIGDMLEINLSEGEECILPDTPTENCPKKRKLGGVRLPPKRKRKFQGMKGYELRSLIVSDFLKFCQDLKLVAPAVTCSCGEPMYLAPRKEFSDGFQWSCRKRKVHISRQSVRKGSWFEQSRLPIPDILWIAYMWVHEYSFVSMLHECDQTDKTLVDWCLSCQDACQVILKTKTEPIGGSGKLVEIFEAKFNDEKSKEAYKKRKKDKCKKWVFCALEQFSTNSVFLVVEDKESSTLLKLFDKYMLPETTVFSHIWGAYQDLSEEHFEYLTNVKSITFHDSNTKTDLDTIEKFWDVAERPRPGLNYWNKLEYGPKFCEFMYRKSLSFAQDAYMAFLKDIAMIYRPQDRVIKEEPLDD